ncbi:hypothetical protein M758_2G241200 [Ceratodon purpureus]|nr:hypothetical protein M758_2G241200 [Ceratodon purpureus]
MKSRPGRQPDYGAIPLQCPIVIDNGAYHCRVGWGGEAEPRLSFRNVLNRPRHRTTGELVSLVGDFDPIYLKLFDFTRSSIRSAFDQNVVYQFETMECILDYAFDRMGCDAAGIEHPILLTEGACNPLSSRNRMAELLFETYGVPSLAFGIDAVFGYAHNLKLGVCERDGLLVNIGHQTTHVIPMVAGEPVLEAACRTAVGGFQVTSYLKRLLSLQYPYHVNSISWEKSEELKQEHCYIAEDYHEELSIFQKGGPDAEAKTRYWQLPFIPPVQKPEQSEEELARKAAIKEKQGQRLRDMANAKRESKIADLEANVQGLEYLLQELDDAEDEKQEASILLPSGYNSRTEAQAALTKVLASLRKAKGQPAEPKPAEEDMNPLSERYPLLEIPDNQLTAEQLKEKKKQRFLKITTEGRIRAKQKRDELNLQRERELQLEEERRLANPELYLEELRTRQAEQALRVEQRKRQKTGAGPGGTNAPALTSGAGGRGERLNQSQKERMKLLTTAAFDRGKEEDTFGMNDEDWQLYKRMSKDADDLDEDDDQDAELTWLTNRLKELDPTFVPSTGSNVGNGQGSSVDLQQQRPLTAEDFRISLGVERFRCPEIIMQPAMNGVDRAGLGEAVASALRRLPAQYRDQVMNGTILLSGGSSLFEGLDRRMIAEVRKTRPLGADIKVVKAFNPLLDAWHGASTFASKSFEKYSFTKADYEERGPEWLRYYNLKYSAGGFSR